MHQGNACIAAQGNVAHYVFVSSAGAYKASEIEPGHVEGDARKSSAGHVGVEGYLQEQGLPFTVFQPLYLYGDHTAKVLFLHADLPQTVVHSRVMANAMPTCHRLLLTVGPWQMLLCC